MLNTGGKSLVRLCLEYLALRTQVFSLTLFSYATMSVHVTPHPKAAAPPHLRTAAAAAVIQLHFLACSAAKVI